jgi:L-asparaginase II
MTGIQDPQTLAQESSAGDGANPVLVEVTRGAMVESRHRGAFAVIDTGGHVIAAGGDIERAVYGRSAIKPLQALAFLESGAAEAYDCSEAEVALACASHSGEPGHVEPVRTWLARIGCGVEDLECGPQMPGHEASARALLRAGQQPSAAHNNCSGKHAGFLTLARHLGVATSGYIKFDHPVQQRVLGILEMMTGLDLREAPRGIDGCGIPQIGIPLGNIALAMARLAEPADQPERRQSACARVRRAMAAHPELVAGSGRFCTRVMSVTGERVLIKTGAEGVYGAALPSLGLGVALKIDDGATRAAEVATGRLLERLQVFDAAASTELADLLRPKLHNRAHTEVGEIRAVADFPF